MAPDPTLISHLKQHRFRELKNTQVSVPELLREEMFISNVAIKLLKPATLTLLVASIVGGCATAPTDRNNASHRPEYAECLSLFEENDAAITLAGVRDVQARQIPGFSFVRTDRFLSSLRGRLNSTVYKKTWIEHLARRDAAGRNQQPSAQTATIRSGDRRNRAMQKRVSGRGTRGSHKLRTAA